MKKFKQSLLLLMGLVVISCGSSERLVTSAVAYQSVRTVQYKPEIPDDATIAVGYSITPYGALVAVVQNLTEEIMIIDQTKSFFVNSDGKSISYYDPTIKTTSNTSLESTTSGATVNLGAVGGALGIGGALGGLLRGINVGKSNTLGSSTTTTTYFADQPQISLAPKSHGAMSKTFSIAGVGSASLKNSGVMTSTYTSDNSYCKFSVCISYSVDGGLTFDKIVTPFYVNSVIICPVRSHGKVNTALREVLSNKPDAIHEPWWMLYAITNLGENDILYQGALTDYK